MEETNVFEVRMTETGMRYVRALKRNFAIYLVLIILLAIISIVASIIDLRQVRYSDGWAFVFSIIGVVIGILTTIGDVIIGFLYLKFGGEMIRSYNEHNQDGFNTSFKNLYLVSVISILLLVLNLVNIFLPLASLAAHI